MYDLLYTIAFHRSGKPRGWLRFLLFKDGKVARPMFRRIVHKKNGRIRPRFAYWMQPPTQLVAETAAPVQTTTVPVALRQEELALQALSPLHVTVEHWRGRADPARLLDKAALTERIQQDPQSRILISAGHDDYRKVQGGIQLCIKREAAMAAEHALSYLQIHPWHPLPRLAHMEDDPDCIVALVLNDEDIGACRMSDLIAAVKELAGDKVKDFSVVIHHMLGHQPEQLADLVLATGSDRCIFWLHDFFSICPNYNLLRNTLSFCNAPPVESNSCNLCLYGPERRDHQGRMAAFFDNLRVDIASPSQVTADFWLEKSGLKSESITIVPHTSLTFSEKPLAKAPERKKITVGYLGAPAQHKGWPVFIDLMHMHADSTDYRFVVMSEKQPRLGEAAWFPVTVTAQTPKAMSDAVAKADVDIVLHWPNWPETFSFTTFEALAGSAFVVTNPGSGNVAAAVEMTGRGAVLQDEADLGAFFTDGRAQALAEKRRAAEQTTEIAVQFSRMSYSLIEKI